MAFVASEGVLQSFDVGTGNREDLLDIITNIAPMDTHLLTMLEKVPASNIIHEWLTDTLAPFGDPANGDADVQAQQEGSDASFQTLVPRKRLCNLTHILRRTFDVSDTQRDINTAGIRDEYTYQMQKASKELARFIEFAILHSQRSQQTVQGNASNADVRKMDGFYAYAAATDPSCATTLGLGSEERGTVTDLGLQSPAGQISVEILNDHLQAMWDKGAETDTVLVPAVQKRAVSALTLNGSSILRQNIQASDRTYIQNIDTYQSDFGTQEFILHRYQTVERASFMERNKLRVAVLRPVLATELAKVGSSTKGMIEWEGTLEVLAPNAIGYIDNLDTVL